MGRATLTHAYGAKYGTGAALPLFVKMTVGSNIIWVAARQIRARRSGFRCTARLMLVHPAGTGGPFSPGYRLSWPSPFCALARAAVPSPLPRQFALIFSLGAVRGGSHYISILHELVAVFFPWVLSDIAATCLSWQWRQCPPNSPASSPSFFRWASSGMDRTHWALEQRVRDSVARTDDIASTLRKKKK